MRMQTMGMGMGMFFMGMLWHTGTGLRLYMTRKSCHQCDHFIPEGSRCTQFGKHVTALEFVPGKADDARSNETQCGGKARFFRQKLPSVGRIVVQYLVLGTWHMLLCLVALVNFISHALLP